MRTVLIADDDPSLRMLVSATLTSKDYEIVEATSGDETLAVASSAKPQVVLLDVRMPGMSGLEVCRKIKADPSLAGTRVVMLTGAATPEDVAAGQAAGADLYLTKPFRPLELLQIVERALL
jgi:CheY-like chemotaxis protein